MPKTINATLKTELEKQENEPVFLVEIALTGTTLRFTDSRSNVVFPTGGNTYSAWGMSFSGIKSTITDEVDRVKISFDNTDLTFSTTYLAVYGFQGKVLTLKRIERSQLGSADYAMTVFAGELGAPTVNEDEIEFEVMSPLYKLDRVFPGRKFQNACQYQFDSSECLGGGASLANSTNGTADAGSDENTLIDSARTEANGWWDFGTLTMTSGNNNGLVRIISHSITVTGRAELKYPFPYEIAAGDTYTIKRGCSKTSRDCKFKFGNWTNFGGFTTLPAKE